MNRRTFAQSLSMMALLSGTTSLRGLAASESALPAGVPANIAAMIAKIMATNVSAINTDWDGSIRMEGLLRFGRRGYEPARHFAESWLQYHIDHDKQLPDAEYYKQYAGPHTRIIRQTPLTFTLYSANLGVAFPAYELFKQTGNTQARAVCLEVATAILQVASRDKFGMLSDDDDHYHGRQYAIPDTTYWATRASAIAASLTTEKQASAIYLEQAILQLEEGIEHFFDSKLGLVRTGLFDGKPGQTYWCRSQGWLLWAIAGLLRMMPREHPKFAGFAASMAAIGEGAKKYQTKDGAFHVLVDDAATPEECTSSAMVLAALKEGMRNGWIAKSYEDFCHRAWQYILHSVDAQGNVSNAYTGWAATAEERVTGRMDEKFRGFVPGVVLLAADEMTR